MGSPVMLVKVASTDAFVILPGPMDALVRPVAGLSKSTQRLTNRHKGSALAVVASSHAAAKGGGDGILIVGGNPRWVSLLLLLIHVLFVTQTY